MRGMGRCAVGLTFGALMSATRAVGCARVGVCWRLTCPERPSGHAVGVGRGRAVGASQEGASRHICSSSSGVASTRATDLFSCT